MSGHTAQAFSHPIEANFQPEPEPQPEPDPEPEPEMDNQP